MIIIIITADWLHAVPISACGLRQNDEAIRLAVDLRLDSEICKQYHCVCSASVETRGFHALSCSRNPGRSQRHHFINNLIWRALSMAGLLSTKEPHGLLRSDNKCPDGLTLIPWRDGHCATWDVTVTDTVAPSYLSTYWAQLIRRLNARKISTLKSPAIIIFSLCLRDIQS